jgi:hypothetical protein
MKKFSALIAAVVVCFAAQAHALTVTVTPTVTKAFDLAFADIPLPDINTFPGFAAIYQVDLMMSATNLQAGEAGFANAGFSVTLDNLTDAAGGWQPNTTQVDTNGAAPGGLQPLFATNVDGGTPGDLQGILSSIAGGVTNAIDPRRTVGQTSPALLGSVFVQWDGVTPANFSTAGLLFSANSTTGTFLAEQQGTVESVAFGVPEPSTIVMAGLSMLGLAFRRRNG